MHTPSTSSSWMKFISRIANWKVVDFELHHKDIMKGKNEGN